MKINKPDDLDTKPDLEDVEEVSFSRKAKNQEMSEKEPSDIMKRFKQIKDEFNLSKKKTDEEDYSAVTFKEKRDKQIKERRKKIATIAALSITLMGIVGGGLYTILSSSKANVVEDRDITQKPLPIGENGKTVDSILKGSYDADLKKQEAERLKQEAAAKKAEEERKKAEEQAAKEAQEAEIQNRIDTAVDAANAEKQKQIDALSDSNKSLQEDNEKLSNEKKTLETDKDSATKAKEQLEKDKETLTKEKDTLTKDKAALQKQVDELKKQLEAKN